MFDLNVTCVAVYYSTGAHPLINAYYGQGNGTILLDDVRCTGNEADIKDCSHRSWTTNNCRHEEDVGVLCVLTGKIQSEPPLSIPWNSVE